MRCSMWDFWFHLNTVFCQEAGVCAVLFGDYSTCSCSCKSNDLSCGNCGSWSQLTQCSHNWNKMSSAFLICWQLNQWTHCYCFCNGPQWPSKQLTPLQLQIEETNCWTHFHNTVTTTTEFISCCSKQSNCLNLKSFIFNYSYFFL